MAIVSPEPGFHSEVGRLLLDLAARTDGFEPSFDVRTTTDGPLGLAYEVPDELATLYLDALEAGGPDGAPGEWSTVLGLDEDGDGVDDDLEPSEDDAEGGGEDEVPKPKRRGRPSNAEKAAKAKAEADAKAADAEVDTEVGA